MSITTARQIGYSDIDLAFKANPNIAYDIAVKRDSAAVRQSVLNILKTNHGEKPFKPNFGANLISYLFENIDSITASSMYSSIETAINNDEPRVEVLNIKISLIPDSNKINITVTVKIISTSETIFIDSSMERLR